MSKESIHTDCGDEHNISCDSYENKNSADCKMYRIISPGRPYPDKYDQEGKKVGSEAYRAALDGRSYVDIYEQDRKKFDFYSF